ncbi:hypothetical protein [Arthrobacter sp. FW306-2-2C-D06B]|uniref:hypothetical protein n=1 Tax=Arthrobacter sp. FW306-2-2C-D06B TaxID=2879618 RepID=UPI001F48EB3B|nr:hypothetical protein [Arthrobacter sp. FW306-2-2C-D06B]UKA60606.1 hypothetical protein LFT47_09865 [Arthrobacter sp. FW306-2-2C-D06B]
MRSSVQTLKSISTCASSSFLSPLVGRLVVEWGVNTQAWYRYGETAAKLPVLEIADRDKDALMTRKFGLNRN